MKVKKNKLIFNGHLMIGGTLVLYIIRFLSKSSMLHNKLNMAPMLWIRKIYNEQILT
jgi:hypothetical protein